MTTGQDLGTQLATSPYPAYCALRTVRLSELAVNFRAGHLTFSLARQPRTMPPPQAVHRKGYEPSLARAPGNHYRLDFHGCVVLSSTNSACAAMSCMKAPKISPLYSTSARPDFCTSPLTVMIDPRHDLHEAQRLRWFSRNYLKRFQQTVGHGSDRFQQNI